MSIEMTPVESSNVHSIGHDPAAGELHVRFKSGPALYIYEGVTAEMHAALMAAESKGSHLHAFISGNHLAQEGQHPHPFRKIPPAAAEKPAEPDSPDT